MKHVAIVVAGDQSEHLLRLLREVYPDGKRSFMREEISSAGECDRTFDVKAISTGRIVFGLTFKDENEEVVMAIAHRYYPDVEAEPYEQGVVVEFQEL